MGNPFEEAPAPASQKAKEKADIFPTAMQFMRNMINHFRQRGDDYSVNEFSEQARNINSGNEYKALEYLEEMAPHGGTINVDEWRLAVNDLSSKRFSGTEKMETDQLRNFFDKEFERKDAEIIKAIEENPSHYSRQDIAKSKANNGRWFNAWEQMGQGEGDFRLACQLIEEEIADQLDWRRNHASTIEEIKKTKVISPNDEQNMDYYRQKHRDTILRIDELRKVRNSLYQKYFKK